MKISVEYQCLMEKDFLEASKMIIDLKKEVSERSLFVLSRTV